MTIFVSIAAYRDPDLVPTIQDCIRRARWPGELRFGICWQHGEGDTPPDADPRRMRVIDVPWQASRGACWARAEIMKLYDGEDYFLQIDSHHRFVQDWDALLLDQAARTGAARPLLTTYAAPFQPDRPLPGHDVPTGMKFNCFRADGPPSTGITMQPDWVGRSGPVRGRFLSAHLLFTLGSFVEDVPYDPDLYFYGEEISLAIRAFTHDYALFHPNVHVMWHQDPRRPTPLHWDDHVEGAGVRVTAAERDQASLTKVNRFLAEPEVGPLACGTARSFQEYQLYSGLDFRRRTATAAVRRGDEPAPPPPPAAAMRTWTLRIGVERGALPDAAFDRPQFWYVGLHDENEVELARQDARGAELGAVLARGEDRIVIERQVRSPTPPARWTIWPVDRRGRWLDKLSGNAAGCLA
jgi:hypothetical protein